MKSRLKTFGEIKITNRLVPKNQEGSESHNSSFGSVKLERASFGYSGQNPNDKKPQILYELPLSQSKTTILDSTESSFEVKTKQTFSEHILPRKPLQKLNVFESSIQNEEKGMEKATRQLAKVKGDEIGREKMNENYEMNNSISSSIKKLQLMTLDIKNLQNSKKQDQLDLERKNRFIDELSAQVRNLRQSRLSQKFKSDLQLKYIQDQLLESQAKYLQLKKQNQSLKQENERQIMKIKTQNEETINELHSNFNEAIQTKDLLIWELKTNLQEKQTSLNQKIKKVQTEYETKLKQLFDRLTSYYSQKEGLASEIQQYKEKIRLKQNQLQEQHHKLSQIEKLLTPKQSDLEKENQKLKQQIQQLTQQLSSVHSELQSGQLALMNTLQLNFQTKLSQCDQRIKKLTQLCCQVKKMSQQSKRTEGRNDDNDSDWQSDDSNTSQDEEEDMKKYKEKCKVKDSEISQLIGCVESYRELVKDLTNQVENKEVLEEYYSEILEIFDVDVEKDEDVHDQLIKMINEFTKKLDSLVKLANQHESKVKTLEEEKKTIFNKLFQSQSILNKLEEQNTELTEKLIKFDEVLEYSENLEELIDELNDQIVSKQTQIMKFKLSAFSEDAFGLCNLFD